MAAHAHVRALFALAVVVGCQGEEDAPAPPPSSCPPPELGLPDGTCIRPGVPPGDCAPGFVHDGAYGCAPILPAEPCPPGLMAVPGETACRSVMACAPGKWGDIPVEASTVYVDASYAGGASDGNAQRPWTTIGAAVAAAAPGVLIAVAEGSYLEDVLISGKAVRLWGVCPDKAEIVGIGAAVAALAITELASGSEVHGLGLRGSNELGLGMSGSQDVTVDRVWVHDTTGRGMGIEGTLGATSVRVSGSLVEASHSVGVFIMGAEATLDGTVVRAILPGASDEAAGRGLGIQDCNALLGCAPAERARVAVRGSVVEQSQEFGLFVAGSDVTVDGTVVRGTLPRAFDQAFGRGINIQLNCDAAGCDPASRSNVTVRGSLVEWSHEVGLFVEGSDATVEATVVRATLPQASDQEAGRGINVQNCSAPAGCNPVARASANVSSSLVEWSHDVGLFVSASDAIVEATLVRNTLPRTADGLFGDGMAVFAIDAPASAVVSGTLIEESARAGLSNFGAMVSLGATHLRCAPFELAGEPWKGIDFVFEDRGDNLCGCPAADHACHAVSANLAPPEPLGGVER